MGVEPELTDLIVLADQLSSAVASLCDIVEDLIPDGCLDDDLFDKLSLYRSLASRLEIRRPVLLVPLETNVEF